MVKSITILGKEKRMQTFNLVHDEYCCNFDDCQCHVEAVSFPKASKRFKKTSIVVKNVRCPKVMSIRCGERISVDDRVLNVGVVKRAIKDRKIIVVV